MPRIEKIEQTEESDIDDIELKPEGAAQPVSKPRKTRSDKKEKPEKKTVCLYRCSKKANGNSARKTNAKCRSTQKSTRRRSSQPNSLS